MITKNYNDPIPHMVIDNFVKDFDSVSDIAKNLYFLTDLGTHDDHYINGLVKRNEFYLYSKLEYKEVNDLANIMRETIWSSEARGLYDSAPYPYPMINSTTHDGMLIGFYGEEGYYSLHKDTSFLTVLVYLHKDKNFSGGDLILSNKTDPYMNREYSQVKIEALPNRAIVFPSCYHHGVSEIKTKDNSVDSMRISFTCFTSFKND
jgi:hypothetical protein